ncbi:hypothetical protein PGTUg99_024713 [Puccinia graminis f. sp. tritici]|uniref:Uncharacterized protein n=1 Tax=Puccinia graminis f. sp. tritici TaxID=56615 RepID=A0A5B0N0U0_PUCGR|nr:hypothetical protein PGTUg99_024713 [Puccinia graminis f. sp. tritici]
MISFSQHIWCCKPVWAHTKLRPKTGQARWANLKARLADCKARVAPSQPPLGTCQSWWGSEQSLA